MAVVRADLENFFALTYSGKDPRPFWSPLRHLFRASPVRHGTFRHEDRGLDAVCESHVEEHAFGDLACHLSWRKIHNKQSLPAFQILEIGTFPFDARKNASFVVAKID